jgi:hypothetical protein
VQAEEGSPVNQRVSGWRHDFLKSVILMPSMAALRISFSCPSGRILKLMLASLLLSLPPHPGIAAHERHHHLLGVT